MESGASEGGGGGGRGWFSNSMDKLYFSLTGKEKKTDHPPSNLRKLIFFNKEQRFRSDQTEFIRRLKGS